MRLLISAIFFIAIIFVFSCTKIDSTALGSDLIPAVDNVNTFDTIIDVVTNNSLQSDDTTKLSYTDPLAVGRTNDPLFGTSDAALYFEMKPTNFPATTIFRSVKDSIIGYDSTVLCLRYSGGFGVSDQNVIFNVYLLTQEFVDTITYSIKQPPPPISTYMVGTKSISLNSLSKDSVPVSRSTTFNYKTTRELRIPLDSFNFRWVDSLLKDSVALSSDVEFTKKIKGFAIKMQPAGTGTMAYFNISDTASKLEFFYRQNRTAPDTTRSTFYFNSNNSGFANNINWTRAGEINAHLSQSQPDPLVYIKTTPGTATRIQLPGLQNVSNRIIHRAELKMYQVPNDIVTDSQLVVPPFLYLERFTPGNVAFNTFQIIPIDLSPNSPYGECFPNLNNIDYGYYGSYPQNEVINGASTKVYTFNISRYVQQIITKKLTNADLRLSSNLYSKYEGCSSAPGLVRVTTNPIAYGRVRLGGGQTTGSNLPYKMRLRIIYSKL